MPFTKGHSFSPGRPPGVPNKHKVASAEELKAALLSHNIDMVVQFWASWKNVQDPDRKCQLVLRFMEFIYPRQRQLEMKVSLEDAIKVIEDAVAQSGQTPITIDATPIDTSAGTSAANAPKVV